MKLYNTFNKQKEEFIPIVPNKVSIYVCGQTVYDYCHLGHARKEIVFDMIRRWFLASNYEVKFIENITDIDDKIIKKANENNETIEQLTSRFIQIMHEDFKKLGVMPPDVEPRATHYIEKMIAIIENLMEKGYAYQAKNNDVYYSVRKFENYGKLSGKALDELNMGERVEIDSNKKDPLDFVLWKSSKANEPFWNSPFGKGRPGWHIECSAMSEEVLGKTFDIHGGGQDLQFPHHENEIAQSEAHNGCKFANYWLHNGFLNINDEKMSKSLGNFLTLREILEKYNPEVIRFFVLRTHYRSPLNFNHINLEDAKIALGKIYGTLAKYPHIKPEEIDWDQDIAKKFKQAMDDDFNTSLAISILFELTGIINKSQNIKDVQTLVNLGNTLGLLNQIPQEFLKYGSTTISDLEVEQLIQKRTQARIDKDFKLSDQIRDQLKADGIVLEDKGGITTWRRS